MDPHTATDSISGLVVEYIITIDVTRVRFLADAFIYQVIHHKSRMHSVSLESG